MEATLLLEPVFNRPIVSVIILLFAVFVIWSIIGTLVGITIDITTSIFSIVVVVLVLLATLEIFGIVLVDHPMVNPFIDLFARFLVELYDVFMETFFGSS